MKMCINSIIYSIPLDYKTIRPGAPKSKQWLLLYGNFHLPFRPPTNPIPTQDTREDKQNIQNVCRYSNEANAHNNGAVAWISLHFAYNRIRRYNGELFCSTRLPTVARYGKEETQPLCVKSCAVPSWWTKGEIIMWMDELYINIIISSLTSVLMLLPAELNFNLCSFALSQYFHPLQFLCIDWYWDTKQAWGRECTWIFAMSMVLYLEAVRIRTVNIPRTQQQSPQYELSSRSFHYSLNSLDSSWEWEGCGMRVVVRRMNEVDSSYPPTSAFPFGLFSLFIVLARSHQQQYFPKVV